MLHLNNDKPSDSSFFFPDHHTLNEVLNFGALILPLYGSVYAGLRVILIERIPCLVLTYQEGALVFYIRFSLPLICYFEYTYYGGETFTFIEFNEISGFSPDGLGEDSIIEIKCPFNSAVHLRNATITDAESLKDNHPEYYWQMQFGMLCTQTEYGIFVSYDPRMPESHQLFTSVIELEDIREEVEEKLYHAGLMLNSIIH